MMRLAGIDIGTNTVRLLIAEFQGGRQYREICSERRITRLGEGLVHTGCLGDTAVERTLSVLGDFKRLCEEHGVARIRSVATSAVREARNGTEFVHQAADRLGLKIEVISGDQEASLTLLGVMSDLEPAANVHGFLMMDIGGGSTEFVFFEAGTPVSCRVSTGLGVVTMTEAFVHSDPVSSDDLTSLSDQILHRLNQVSPPVSATKMTRMIGTAGTVTTLAAIQLGLAAYRPEQVHHTILKKATVDHLLHRFTKLSSTERLEIPGLELGREDIILAGTLIVQKSMERFGFDEMIVSDYGLREGIVLSLYDDGTQTVPASAEVS